MRCKKPSLLVLACVTAVFVAILFTGCSKPFVPYFLSKSARDNTEVTHHWDVFATDVAGQIKRSLENAGIHDNLPIYVETSRDTSFGDTFSDLLTARLEEMGLTTIEEKADAVFTINNSIRVICHTARQITDPLTGSSAMFVPLSEGVTVARGSGEIDEKEDLEATDDVDEIDFTGDFPPTEVVITTNLFNDTDILMQHSDIYYIKDPDFWCYAASPRIHEQSSEKAADVTSGEQPPPDPEVLQEETIQDVTEQTPEQMSASSPMVVNVPASTKTVEQDAGSTSEQVKKESSPAMPEEMPKPLPELKVKGHF